MTQRRKPGRKPGPKAALYEAYTFKLPKPMLRRLRAIQRESGGRVKVSEMIREGIELWLSQTQKRR